ncbi:hypothetical protein SAMN05421542_4381 [Chryseobacterium jejuense]|uniref:Uncharacterized protein n=1 Tax=Chryseobacterium jejuense TaxID=445960 RepID=A0A2X2WSQ8_CHRJE|nr:hypothetical protein SAMN05421542_4381 [Chryseobacterium jejuense]SQB43504.1 Uncharacterised protein [Chryseobacterium jejuense]
MDIFRFIQDIFPSFHAQRHITPMKNNESEMIKN